MKKHIKNKKIKTLIIILILLSIAIYFLLKTNNEFFKDDIILFKNFYSSINKNNSNENKNKDIIKVSQKNENTKEMTLFSNIKDQTNWNKTICPGTKGEFSIKLYGQEKLQYEITFKSKNQKPKNLVFKQNGKEYETLEQLGERINGNIEKGETKNIVIEWEWRYETNEKQDFQDTKDGKEIREYKFEIIVQGK